MTNASAIARAIIPHRASASRTSWRTAALAVALSAALVALFVASLHVALVAGAVRDCELYGAADACADVAAHPVISAFFAR